MTAGDGLLKVEGASLASAVIGWADSSLTIAGRVTAIESSMTRIETRLDVLTEKGLQHGSQKAPDAAPR